MTETRTEQTAPALGTTEAAVRSCVSVIAAVTAQREEILAYWLDLYFQVRLAYEREHAPEPDPTILRRGDLYPVLRELMCDALKSAEREEARERIAKRSKKDGQTEVETLLQACERQEISRDEMHEGFSQIYGGELRAAEAPAEAPAAAEESEPPKLSYWARTKRDVRDRLIEARDRGATIAQIVAASDGSVTEREIIRILNSEKVAFEIYKRVEAALDAMQK